MQAQKRKSRIVLGRTFFLMIMCGVMIFAPLVAQLYKLQIVEHDFWESKAVEQQTRDTVITPKRGTIYDRNMKPLAISANVATIVISPAEINEKKQDVDLISRRLSEILGVDYEFVLEKTKKLNRQYEIIKKKVEQDIEDQVHRFITDNDIKGVFVVSDTKRYYTYGNFASHVIGFVGDENQGLDGIEAIYDNYLKGKPGRIITAKNAKGTDMSFKYEKYYDAEDGLGVVLTIDETIQHFLEKHLQTSIIENKVTKKGAAIAMDVKTGEILGMATKGDFDPNNPREITDEVALSELAALSGDEYNSKLRETQMSMWRNKAVVDTYEPGSTFKIITTSMALEEKVVSLDSQFFCRGSVTIPGWSKPISCWRRQGHGAENFVQGVYNSCNPVFIAVGQAVGRKTFYDYMNAFGLMNKTGINLPGEANSITHPFDSFTDVSLAVYSFGQTFKVTPIQLITAVSAVANGGNLMMPHIVKQLVNSEGGIEQEFEPEVVRQVISKETSKTVCDILEGVVSQGTGKGSYVKGYRIAGKTGTAEKKDQTDQEGKYIVSFIGFAPADDPQVAVLVMLDEPMKGSHVERSGGRMAAPLCGAIMEDILPYLGVEPVYTADELAGKDELVPKLDGLTLESADDILKKKGFKYKKIGDGDVVTDQLPAVGAKIPASSEIVLYFGTEKPEREVTVPNLRGMSPETVNKTLTNLGLYMKASGATSSRTSGVTATSQSPEPGTGVPLGSVINVVFLDAGETDQGVSVSGIRDAEGT